MSSFYRKILTVEYVAVLALTGWMATTEPPILIVLSFTALPWLAYMTERRVRRSGL